MSSGDRSGKRKSRQRAAVIILGGMLATGGFFPGAEMFCEARETGKAVTAGQKKTIAEEEKEVVKFVTAYWEALSPDGIETLADYVDDPDDPDFQRGLLQDQELFKFRPGIKGWENFKVVVCPMSDEKHWVASVSADMIVEDFDVGIPGLRAYLVCRNEEGELKIVLSGYAGLSDELLKEMRELMLSDEIVDHSNEIAMAYNELVAERPDIMEWLMETQNVVDRAESEGFRSVKADTEKEKSDVKKGSYTVKKGDCLWSIAEEQLGDGMLWSRLYERNKDVIGDNPDLLYVGITLQLGDGQGK